MPKDEQEPTTAKAAPSSDDEKSAPQDGDKPQKVTIPGIGEVNVDEVAKWKEAKDNDARWKQANEQRSIELNEQKRELGELKTAMTDKLSTLEQQLSALQKPQIDLNSIIDPDERRAAEIQILKAEIDSQKAELQKTKDAMKANDEKAKQERQAAYWQGIIDDTVDKFSKGLDEDEVEDLLEKTEAKMGRIHPSKWTPDLWRENAQLSRTQMDKRKQRNIDQYAKRKNEGDKEIGIDTGSAEEPKKERILPGDDQETRIKKMQKNMGR